MNLKTLLAILDYVRAMIKLAEMSSEPGEKKKEFVMSETQKLCNELNVNWDSIKAWVSFFIDLIVLIYNLTGIFTHKSK